MKKYIALLSLIFIGTLAFGQQFEAPKKGAKIYADKYEIAVDKGSETTFDLWIVRSKFAKKSTFMAPKIIGVPGMDFKVSQDNGNQDHYTVTVAAQNVQPGKYTATVSARSTGTQKVTGTTLTFIVSDGKPVASKDGE